MAYDSRDTLLLLKFATQVRILFCGSPEKPTMAAPSQQFQPRKLSDSQFRRSNVFIAWSHKAGRQVSLIGPTQYDSWLMVEFDSAIEWFCERPPMDIQLLPLEGKSRPLDFWIRLRSGKQYGVIVHDAELARDKSCPIDLLKRSLEASKMQCDIWYASDMRSRRTYIRNLKQLQPFVAMEAVSDEQLSNRLMAYLERANTATWSELKTLCASYFGEAVNMEIARLIHGGRVRANLSDHPLASNTRLSLP